MADIAREFLESKLNLLRLRGAITDEDMHTILDEHFNTHEKLVEAYQNLVAQEIDSETLATWVAITLDKEKSN